MLLQAVLLAAKGFNLLVSGRRVPVGIAFLDSSVHQELFVVLFHEVALCNGKQQ